jgi:hypothetical protein
MSKTSGFLQLRRGIWEHVRNGSLTQTCALVYIYMLCQADTRTGIWKGCAQSLAADLGIPKSTAKYALRRLDGRYIRRFPIQGRHFCYPILLHKFVISQGQQVGLRLDALNSTSENTLTFLPGTSSPDVVPDVVPHVDPQRIKETREERQKPAAKPVPPADPRFQPFLDFAFGAFEAKHRQKPTWRDRDFKALSMMLASNRAIDAGELERRFGNYLGSTEPFTQKQGGSLAYFCDHVDSFLTGPILGLRKVPDGKQTGSDLAIQNARALGLGQPN